MYNGAVRWIGCVVLLGGCALPDPMPHQEVEAPDTWVQSVDDELAEGWLRGFGDSRLVALVERAVAGNHGLAQQAGTVRQAEQRRVIAGGARGVQLNLSLSRERRSNGIDVAGGAIALDFDVDPWRRLSDAERQAELLVAAERNDFRDLQLRLVAEVCRSWFSLLETEQLLELSRQRLENLQEDVTIVAERYRAGLSPALDLYLARNNLEAERASLTAQEQTRGEHARALERLLGDAYPGGTLETGVTLPTPPPLAAGLPAELLKRRPDLQATWLRLLAAHARLAVAYKDRFPSLRLSSQLRNSTTALTKLLEGGWLSLALSVGQTLFDGGTLRAEEQLARVQMQNTERAWLEQVYTAFMEVENAIAANHSAALQYDFYGQARDNAVEAERLSTKRYQRGLENYNTVLEAERRAFDARTRLIQLQALLLQQRVALLLALGGNY